MSFHIVGTAGHIDHGKTELSKALTGVMTDRLAEEQERGISIKLGFAPLTLDDGTKIGLVDVPGHEKFIRQMLAGIGGMDLVILVIDANEGIMPQTKEHLGIIKLLGLKDLIVALTKIDLVDAEWLSLMEEEVREYLEKNNFTNIPIIPVDSISFKGIDLLKETINEKLKELPSKKASSYKRMPIDRAFTLPGFGTIVTGTLWSGEVALGDSLELLPLKKTVKVRNIQVHGEDQKIAYAGQRVALNIPDTKVKDFPSGSLLVREDSLPETYKVTAFLNLLDDKGPFKTRQRVRIHLGTSETLGRLILLEDTEIRPGEAKLCAFYLDKPLNTTKGDLLIIRTETPTDTIGGAQVIENKPTKIKALDKDYLLRLRKKLEETKETGLLFQIEENPFITSADLEKNLLCNNQELKELLEEEKDNILEIAGGYLLKNTYLQEKKAIIEYISQKHLEYPLRSGVLKEEIHSQFFKGLNNKIFSALMSFLNEEEELLLKDEYLYLKDYEPIITEENRKLLAALESLYLKDGFMTKSLTEACVSLDLDPKEGPEYFQYLINKAVLVKIGGEIYFHKNSYQERVEKLQEFLKEHGILKLSDAKEIFKTSRKYLVPILEDLDSKKITRRKEDIRTLF